MIVLFFFLVSLCSFSSFIDGAVSLSPDDKPVLNILGLFPYYGTTPIWEIGYLVIPAAQVAVDRVNQDPSLLPNYNFSMIMMSGGCYEYTDSAVSMGIALLTNDFVGIVGAPCTPSSILVSNISNYVSINQITYAAEFPDLSDTFLYPYLFRTSISHAHLADGFSELLKALNRHSVIVVAEIGLWVEAASFFSRRFILNDVRNEVVYNTTFSSEDTDATMDAKLEAIRSYRKHIIVTFLVENTANALMCRASKLKMTWPNYLWIHHVTNGDLRWWQQIPPGLKCTKEEMYEAHRGALMQTLELNTTNVTEYKQFEKLYAQRLAAYLIDNNVPNITNTYPCLSEIVRYGPDALNQLENGNTNITLDCLYSAVHVYALLAHDAVMVLARALHEADLTLLRKHNQTLAHFVRGNNIFSESIHESLKDTKFYGVSGYITYPRGGNKTLDKNTRPVKSAFYLIGDDQLVASYDASNFTGEQFKPENLLTEINRSIPIDDLVNYPLLFYPGVGALLFGLNIFFFLTLAVFLIFNNLYFQHQPFKGSDGVLTNFEIAAVYLQTTGSLVTAISASVEIDNRIAFEVAANYATLLTDVGLILFLAIASGKSYRFYNIFKNFNKRHRFLDIKYFILMGIIAAGLTIVYEIVVISITPFERSPQRECHYNLDGTIQHCFYYIMDPRYANVIVILSAALMCAFLFLLGFQSGSIKDPRFYDVHNNAMIGVGLIIYCVVAVISIFALPKIFYPFMHAMSTTVVGGITYQLFFILPLLSKFCLMHRDKAKIKCHCVTNEQRMERRRASLISLNQ